MTYLRNEYIEKKGLSTEHGNTWKQEKSTDTETAYPEQTVPGVTLLRVCVGHQKERRDSTSHLIGNL